MKRGDWMWGVAAGIVLGVLGFGLRGFGVGWPLEGMFAEITYWLGVPAMFNFIHKLLGFSDLAKNLAFIGTAFLWLFLHPFLFTLLGRWFWAGLALAFVFYGAFGGWLLGMNQEGWVAAVLYTVLVGALAWAVRPKGKKMAEGHPDLSNPARRESLKTLAVVAVGLALWQTAKAQAKIMWDKITGLSPEQIPQKDLYYVSKNIQILDPKLGGKPYKLELAGLVDKPQSFTLDDLKALPGAELTNTMTCISNEVGGNLIGCVRWRGVPLKAVLEKAGVKSEAKFMVWEAADRYTESIPVAEIPAEAMIAYAAQDPASGKWEDLAPQHGYPTRLLLPGRYGMKQPKWITKISPSAAEVAGYWAQRGWSRDAVIRTMSRIDTPKDRAPLKAGAETFVGGIAYAGGRALERVEVSADGGKTWQKAELKPPKSKYSWQQWAFPWKPAPGNYDLMVRAVEVGEKVQDATPRDPLPDGATGYHKISVRVG